MNIDPRYVMSSNAPTVPSGLALGNGLHLPEGVTRRLSAVTLLDGATIARNLPRTYSPLGMTAIGLLAVLVYVVVVGGTGTGELSPVLRAINSGIAAILFVAYVTRAPGRADRLDQAMIVALALFAVTGAVSLFVRQSLDAVLTATVYVAGFYLARTYLAAEPVRRTLMRVFMGLSAAFTFGTAIVWLPHFVEWWSLTGWTPAPRLNLPFHSGPWGYRYDVVLLMALLYPAWWTGAPSRTRRAAAVAIGLLGLVLVILSGSRTVWLSLVIASLVAATPVVLRGWHQHRRALRWVVIATPVLVAALLLSGTLRPVLDRGLSLGAVDWRIAMWGPLMDLWLSHPLAGVGPGSFPWALQLTPYFETNSLAPRHPDSPVVQLLVEAGLLGVAAATLVAVAAVTAVVRGQSRASLWALIAGGVACLGTNPTDFAFLVVVLLAWTAYAVPRGPAANEGLPPLQRMPVVAALALTALIYVAYGATLVGGFAYEAARSAVIRGDLHEALASLDTAVAFDPGMALYWRQRGVASYLLGDHGRALSDLARATELNPVDDVAWRATALVRSATGDKRAATNTIEMALTVQRSDVSNLLTSAWLLRREGQDEAAVDALAEVVQAWPAVIGAPGWSALVPEGRSIGVLDTAASRWARGDPAPHHYEGQDHWLALMTNGLGARDAGGESVLVRAIVAARRCEPEAENLLAAVDSADRGEFGYWEARVRVAANRGERDDDAVRGYFLSAGTPEMARRVDARLNPLNEGGWWGYRRMPIFWPPTDPALPDPSSGGLRWLFAPHDAVAEAGLGARLPDCQRETNSESGWATDPRGGH